LHATLLKFGAVAERRGEASKAAQWRKDAYAIQQAIEREAWDGDWYRRGYFDDGSPLGSVSSEECRIDAIAQSWGVISGAAEAERAARAMSAVNAQLVSRSDGLVKLFTPRSTAERMIRLHSGVPTRACVKTVSIHACSHVTTLAFAMMGDGDRAV